MYSDVFVLENEMRIRCLFVPRVQSGWIRCVVMSESDFVGCVPGTKCMGVQIRGAFRAEFKGSRTVAARKVSLRGRRSDIGY
jgi:hypothetical protein